MPADSARIARDIRSPRAITLLRAAGVLLAFSVVAGVAEGYAAAYTSRLWAWALGVTAGVLACDAVVLLRRSGRPAWPAVRGMAVLIALAWAVAGVRAVFGW